MVLKYTKLLIFVNLTCTKLRYDILHFSGVLVALATFDALCWIMSVIVSLILSMSSSSCIYDYIDVFSKCNTIGKQT